MSEAVETIVCERCHDQPAVVIVISLQAVCRTCADEFHVENEMARLLWNGR